ncbi:MAG: DUF616 domain-containing protein [Lachnospiraceae bacterium]|nr:DUF616 domain-containing protein [Lachnospiraceae bacterium]
MDRSANILSSLKNCVAKGNLSIEDFPIEDVTALLYAEYKAWTSNYIQKLSAYVDVYDRSINMAVKGKDEARLIILLEEMVSDLDIIAKEENFLKDKKKKMEEEFDESLVRQFQKYAKSVYEKYYQHSCPLNLAFHGKGVIYTVVTGGYDTLCEPEYIDKNFDYICFTDNQNLTSNVWSFRHIDNNEKLDMARLSRKYKILCHEYLTEYDFSIYIDGKIQIIGDLRKYMETYSRGSAMLCFPHFVRDCAYEEAEVCASIGKDVPEIIEKQMSGYSQEGYPANNGLIDGACLVRLHHDHILQNVMLSWWNEVKNKSRRDQLSFGYACWKNNFHYDLSDLYTYKNDFLRKSREWEKPY